MAYGVVADGVMLLHFAFILFVAAGALLAWKWPRVAVAHLPALAYAVVIVTVGFDCPLTPVEKHFRALAGVGAYRGGFVDRYIENVIYPESLTPLLRAAVALLVLVGYAGLLRRRARGAPVVSS